MNETDTQNVGGYHIVLDGGGAFSGPYTSREKAEEKCEEFNDELDVKAEFVVEEGPGYTEVDSQ